MLVMLFLQFSFIDYQPRNYVPFAGCITAVKVNDKPVSLVNDDFRYSGSIMRGCANNE